MKFITKSIQNPYIRIFLSPLATVIFGLIVGRHITSTIVWSSFIYLCLLTISAGLINHLFYLRFDRRTPEKAPMFLLYIFEAILIIISILLMFNSHWIVNILLLFYIIFLHIQYLPFKMTGTLYHLILNVFFNGFVLNTIAYNSQTYTVTTDFLLTMIPIVIMFTALYLEEFGLKYLIINHRPNPLLKRSNIIVTVLAFIALFLSIYFSLPSNSYFIVQILFFLIISLLILPLLVSTRRENQAQNKINYIHAVTLIYTLLYSLSYIY